MHSLIKPHAITVLPWYKKLKESGFEDAEKGEFLTRNHRQDILRKVFDLNWLDTVEYFSEASNFLHSYEFKRELDRKIWELHCEGLSGDEISEKLKSSEKDTSGTGATQVYFMIDKLKSIMVSKWKR